ncbi:hypothetical protein PIB30_060643 [Stylosanthes scabra]|uniref:AAA+ ATPase domain-containing protein n=1 Tax=Stylosanthes scabra TaxID=79078 RepID=A0ABU6SLH3_9FABA|nr:hypothetical protein [Stylosanthes scabra]
MNDAVSMPNPNDMGTPNHHAAAETKGLSGTKRRKCNKIVTTPKKVSKSSTTKKNVLDNGIKETVPSVQKIDLLLEAKLSAEENSRMYSGRQIHPFFSSWKLGKKSQELNKTEPTLSTDRTEDRRKFSGPVHVFENCEDDTSSLDWNNWTFLGTTTVAKYSSENSNLPVLMGSVEPLNFDNLQSAVDQSHALISQNSMSCSDGQLLQEISLANSVVLPNEQPVCLSKEDDSKMDLEVDGVGTFSGQAGCFRSSDTQSRNRFLQESMNSYYHSCEGKSEGSLWTDKYKPTNGSQVCGNYESVNFLCEWLKLWRERRNQSKMYSANVDQSDSQDYDYNGSDCDYDSEKVNQYKFLRNVLVITGPVGSGKSAAVYACAQEQGFEVLELNASDWRNGTAVKRYFGDALGSHGLKSVCSQEKKAVKLPSAPSSPNDKAAEDIDKDVIELITISDDGSKSPDGTSWSLPSKNGEFTCHNVQTLILVEDVDVLFPQDRGCISAIRHIAETAKGPIILTSNSNKVGLPDNFDRLNISFSLPLADELLCHLYMVCVAEDVKNSPLLLERFILSCKGDIRKIIMQLQFWFQSKQYAKDQKVQTAYSSIPFDLEATQQILSKIIPWSFPSELSKLIEKEVAKSITITEENSCMQGLVTKEFHANERKIDSDVQSMETNYVDASKRKRCISKCSKSKSQYSTMFELSSCSGLQGVSYCQNCQEKPLISSGSVNKDLNDNGQSTYFEPSYSGQPFEVNNEFPCNFQPETYTSMSFHKIGCSGLDDCKCSQTAEVACLTETSKSFDLSCVPELTYSNGTATENRIGTTFSTVSYGFLFPNNFTPFALSDYQGISNFPQKLEPLDARIQESYSTEAVQDFRDECSHGFKPKSEFDSDLISETDVVQNLWRKLRDGRVDLGQHGTAEHLGAIQVVKLVSGLSNLLSESDLLFRNHQEKQCGIMEHPKFLSEEATFSWYDEQAMMTTVAVHGFCFYAKCISDVGSIFSFEPKNNTDIISEMLASTTNLMTLGKLSRQDPRKIATLYTNRQFEVKKTMNDMKSESKTSLTKVIQSIVPTRLSLALKGTAFNEYLSSVRQISISEGLCILQGAEKKRGRRGRSAQHYLSRGTMMSPEDISLVCQGDLYSKMPSKFAAEAKSNST